MTSLQLSIGAAARRTMPWILVGVLALALGAALAGSEQVALLLLVATLGALALTAPTTVWILVALVVALTFRGLVTLGAPSVVSLLDIPLAWGALAAALLRRRSLSASARRHLSLLAALAIAVLFSWIANPSEAARPFLYLALLGQPFSLVGAVLVDPPSPRLRRALTLAARGLLVLQIPVCYWQMARIGISDDVQGTLYGAGAGAHTISAVIAVGIVWLLADATRPLIYRLVLAGLLVPIPFVADAKQVIFALPAGLLFVRWPGRRFGLALRGAVVGVSIAALLTLDPFGGSRVAQTFLERASEGRAGKLAVAEFVGERLTDDPESFLFGKGPAETVSRAAFMTTIGYAEEDSALTFFRLRPAAFASDAQARAADVSGYGLPGFDTSFNSGVSSALGVLGDLGVLGMLAYGALLGSVILSARKTRSAESAAAGFGWAMFVILGFIFDWWEQPPFSMFLAVLTGLALTGGAPSLQSRSSDPATAPSSRIIDIRARL